MVSVPPAVVLRVREPPFSVKVPVPKLRLLFAELPRKVRVLLNMIPLLFVSVMAAPLVLLILLADPEAIFNAPELIA